MSLFTRGLPSNRLDSLRSMASEGGDNWWKDLLLLWRPNGQPAGEDGLRLAVRNGYLNFYFQGQSIAKVCFGRGGAPYVETHVKYVADGQQGQKYAKLAGQTITLPNGGGTLTYEGLKTLRQWISRVSPQYVTKEKSYVDELVAANSSVIDLEMGLPAWGDRRSALRVDLVTLTKALDGTHLAFWEAKLMSDSRLRSRTKPEVFDQIEDYEAFLADVDHRNRVQAAYCETCELLVKFKAMAERNGHPGVALEKAFIETATGKSRLIIDRSLRLAILKDTETGGGGNWNQHERKLQESGVNFIILNGANPLDRRLPGVAG